MARKRTVGVALSEAQASRLDELAVKEGLSRSAMAGRLIDERGPVRAPVVVVDGRRFVPARVKRSA